MLSRERQLSPDVVYICRAPSAKTLILGRLADADERTIPRRRGGDGSEGGQQLLYGASNDQRTGRSVVLRLSAG